MIGRPPSRVVPGAKKLPVLALTALCASGGVACRGCHDDHPFVPYTIGTEDGAVAAARDAAADVAAAREASAAAGDAAAAGVEVAPPGLTTWSLDGITLGAPEGRVFALAIVRDVDGDGLKDAFAVVRRADASGPGDVIFYRGSALAAPVVFSPPQLLPFDPRCSAVVRLAPAGARSVLAELGESCSDHAPSGPDRWMAVIAVAPAPGAPPRIRLAATIADPLGAPVLSVDAQVADRDGDGLDDVALTVAIEGGGPPLEPGPRVGVTLAWLDRPAGLSRDAGATEASFAALAASAAARAVRVKEAPSVPAFVGQARTLWRAVCAEGDAPRLVGVGGTAAIGCGGGRALGDLGLAEVRAHVTMGDALRAALALDRVVRPPAVPAASRATEAQAWIAQIAPTMAARHVRSVAAVPLSERGHEPAWGPLAFEPGGKLLVRTAAGVVRVDPDQGDEAAADAADWKPAVVSPDATQRWIEAYDPCDGLSLRATFASSAGDDLREVALPVLPPLAGRCGAARGAAANVVPIAWGPGGLEAIVEGEPVLVSADLSRATALASFVGQPYTRGAPRSPDGTKYVVATSLGILVRGPSGARMLRARDLDGSYGESKDCAVADDGVHVACMRSGVAWVGAWGP